MRSSSVVDDPLLPESVEGPPEDSSVLDAPPVPGSSVLLPVGVSLVAS